MRSKRMPTAFGVVLALSLAVLMLAIVLNWYRTEIFLGTTIVCGAIALFLTFWTYRQVSERQATSRALENVQARVGDILESAMDPIITVDEEQRIVLFNKAAEDVFRRPRAAVIGQSLDLLIPLQFRDAHRGHIERFGETGMTSRRMGANTTLIALRADGGEFPIEASISQHSEDGKKLYTVILRDITARLESEGSLARSEARLRGILDSAMDAIITVDERQHIVLFNKAAEVVFGYPREHAIGAPLSSLIPARFHDVHSEHIRKFGETDTNSRRMSAQRIVTGLRRNGEEFPIDASISQLSERGNKFYTVILRDVTEIVRGEEALRRSKEELRELAAATHSAREQEKTRIARELHDELGQALTALKMDTVWLKEKTADHAAVQKLEGMLTMLDNTVAAARRISADLRPLMLDDLGLIPATEWLVQNFTERTGIRCKLSVGEPEPSLRDPYATALFRIIQESLTNVSKHAQASLVDVTVESHGDTIVIRVRDNGIGFSTSDPRKPNSFGLIGLRERAHLLGGEVKVESAPGKGTTVEVRLPVAAAERQS